MVYCIRRITKDHSTDWELIEEANTPLELAIKFSELNNLKRGTTLLLVENKSFSAKKFHFTVIDTEPYKIKSGIIKPKNDEDKPSEDSLNHEQQEDTSIDIQQSYQFRTLLSYGKFISGFGRIIGILGVIAIIWGIISGEEAGFGIAVGALFLVVIGVVMVVNGQLMSCFVSIEKNTRTTCELLKRIK